MRVDIITLFPAMFAGPLEESILRRARERGLLDLAIHDLRNYTTDKHRTADDYSYGGGPGMVMKPEPIFAAVEALRCAPGACPREEIILLTPQGELLSQQLAADLAAAEHLILICGRYEGVDERVRQHLATREVSIGDYVLAGGELPAMVLVEVVTRLLPGAIGAEEGTRNESFADGLLEHPQYTRPADFRGLHVPEVLLSGNHEQIRRWRRKESLRRTLLRRPELLERAALNKEDRQLLEELTEEAEGEPPQAS